MSDFEPLSGLAEVNPTTALPSTGIVSFIGMEDVSEGFELTETHDRSVKDATGYTRFREGDLLFAKITPCMENGKGAIARGLINGYGFGSTEFHVLRAREADALGFVAQWLQSPHLRQAAEAQMTGSAGQRRVPTDFFDRFDVPALPLAEQRRVAEILDTLDDQIRATELLIGKLKLVKAGSVRDMLSNGVNEDGEVRDHPLGDTHSATRVDHWPSSWMVSSVVDQFEIKAGITLGVHRRPRSNPAPYLRVANVQRERIGIDDVAQLEASLTERADYGLREGDLLIVEGHASIHEIGRCARVEESAAGLLYQNHLFRLRSRSLLPDFSEAWLNSNYARRYWRAVCSSSSGLNTINSTQLRAMAVVVPPMSEQHRIVEIIRSQSKRIWVEESTLEKLRILKQGVLSDLLTGRVRVTVEAAS